MMRKEHGQSSNIYNKNYTFTQIEGGKEHMLETHKWCVELCVRQITMFHKEALDSCHKRWMLPSLAIRGRDPFGVPKFSRALERMPHFIACIHTCGVIWMGLRFQFPLIQFPSKKYTSAYNVIQDWWKDFVLTEGYKPPGTEMAGDYDLAQLHAFHNQSNPDLTRRRAT